MPKVFFIVFFVLISRFALAQNEIVPTSEFLITGKVKNERKFSIAELKKMKSIELENINTRCSPKTPESAKKVKAVLFKALLDSVTFDVENRGMLNRFYFKFVASDGYTLVYSYNEILNTETGKHMYLVTEMDGMDILEMANRILLLTTSDLKTGRRNMKGLSRVVVCEAD